MPNSKIREAARESGVRLWQIAERWGCNDGNFSRKLRCQFSPEAEARALKIIDEFRGEAEGNAKNENDPRGR